MTRRRTLPILCGVTALLAACAEPAAPVVEARGAWCRASPGAAETGACYVTLTASRADTLLAVETGAAARAEVHEMLMDGNIMRMREMESGLKLPAGEAVSLAPGGAHLMLIGLAAPLAEGETVVLTLTFENAPPVSLDAPVLRQGPEGGHAGH